MKFDGFVENIPDPPLIETAPLARSLSRRLCLPGPDSCADYHGLRPYWRILNLVTSPSHHAFHVDQIRQLASTGEISRILISGCADHDQLANVLHACRLAGVDPEITVVDRCRTPLELCRWYARRKSASIETVCSDILDFDPRRPFDLLCTHSFLSWFPPGERRRVIGKWHALLRPGGVGLTVTRIRPPSTTPGAVSTYDESETEAFCSLVLQRALALQDRLDVSAEQLQAWGREYRRSYETYGVRSAKGLGRDFRDAGFEVGLSRLESPRRKEWRREKNKAGRVRYLGVVATRPR